jgi:hypothetical protein
MYQVPMFQECLVDGGSKSVYQIRKWNVNGWGGIACTATDVQYSGGMSKRLACQVSVGETRAECGEFPLKGVTVGKIEGWLRRYSYMGNSTTDGLLPSVIGCQTCCPSSSMRKYWCGWTGSRF